jgi:hypothetical protein
VEVLSEIVNHLRRLGSLTDSFLLLKVDRRQHVDQLMIRIQANDLLRIERSGS